MSYTAAKRRGVSRALDPECVRRLWADLVATLTVRARDVVLAEDLAQQTFVKLLDGLPEFRGDASLRTWARRIAENVWRDHVRREALRSDAAGVLCDPDHRQTASVPSAEALRERVATRACLASVTDGLAPAARRLFVLHDIEDTTLPRAAELVGSSYGAAKVRLHRARRHVVERCRAECEPGIGADGSLACTPKRGVR
jgi:RNA polymerase sigma-70 factor (ECF subfamily)